MSTATLEAAGSAMTRRARNTREGWSAQERRRRRLIANRKVRELALLIDCEDADADIWATGSLTVADVQRLVG